MGSVPLSVSAFGFQPLKISLYEVFNPKSRSKPLPIIKTPLFKIIYFAVYPPSTNKLTPVIHLEASDNK